MKYVYSCLVIILLLVSSLFSVARQARDIAMNYKLWGLSSHVGKDVFTHIGAQVDRDYYLRSNIIFRVGKTIYKDTRHLWAGGLHVGLRFEAQKFNRVYMRVGMGPTFLWRQNWFNHFPTYSGDTFYGKKRHSRDFETAFLWWGGDIEFEWKMDERKSMLIAIVPGFPVVVNANIGLRVRY